MPRVTINSFISGLDRNLNARTKDHLKNVYGTVTMGLFAAACGVYTHIYTEFLQAGFLVAMMSIGCLLGLMFTPDEGNKNRDKRIAMFGGFAFCSGIALGPLCELAMFLNPSLIATALAATSIIFACFTLAAIFADKRQTMYLAGTLGSAALILLLSSLANLLFRSYTLSILHLYLGLFLVAGFIMYDTMIIIQKAEMGETDYIWHSVLLFMDSVDVFRTVLAILTEKESRRDRRSNK